MRTGGWSLFIKSSVLALFVLLPLFRPILIVYNAVAAIYLVFFLAFLILLSDVRVLRLAPPRLTFSLGAFLVLASLSSLVVNGDVRGDVLGLLFFLLVSFYLGLWLVVCGGIHHFFRVAAVIFIPVALYIVWCLSRNSFSYNTYYYWSNALFKIDYLTLSLYAFLLALYFGLNGRGALEQYGLPLFFFAVMLISGARYSILFAGIALMVVGYRALRQSPGKLFTLIGIAGVVLTLAVVEGSILKPLSKILEYSVYRLENLAGEDHSVDSRLLLIDRSEEVIMSNFFFGVGVGVSADVLGGIYPHNLLLEAFIDGGIFCALALLLFFVFLLQMLIRQPYQQKFWTLLAFIYLLGAFLKSFSLYESRVLFFFAGVALAYLRIQEAENRIREKASYVAS